MVLDLNDSLVTKDGFWKSKLVREAVSNLDGFKNYPENEEKIEILRKEVIRLNSRNRYIGPKGPGFILMHQIEFCDGKSNYPAFRMKLFFFINLLVQGHKILVKKYGENYLDKVRSYISGDPRAKAFLALMEANIGSRHAFADALEKVGRKGIIFEAIGGIGGGYKDRDCGIEPLVQVTTAIEKFSRVQAKKERENDRVAVCNSDRNCLPKAIVKMRDGGLISVTYNKKTIDLTKKESIFVSQLFFARKPLTYQELWENIYLKDQYMSTNSGVPPRLKTLKKEVLSNLKESFGPLPNKAEWITTVKNFGYSLNQKAVVWSGERNFKDIVQKHLTNWKDL